MGTWGILEYEEYKSLFQLYAYAFMSAFLSSPGLITNVSSRDVSLCVNTFKYKLAGRARLKEAPSRWHLITQKNALPWLTYPVVVHSRYNIITGVCLADFILVS